MKALLDQDSAKGAAFAKIIVSGIGEDINPAIIITRQSDSFSLTRAGWLPDRHVLAPVPSYTFENCLEIFLDPEITRQLNPNEEYTLILSGAHTLPLEWDGRFKKLWNIKWAQEENGVILAARSSVKPSPYLEGEENLWADDARGDANSGVSAIPNVPVDSPGRRMGCWFFLFIFIIFWAIGAWYLWHLSMNNTPAEKNPDERTSFFEIIPGSDERTSVDDEMEERKSGKD